jgi:hypothetical protein
MADILTNQGQGTVTSGGTTAPAQGTSESWTVTAANAFPAVSSGNGTTFKFMDPAVSGEIMMATSAPGGTGAGQSWTVTRGAEGTTPVAHAANLTIYELVTAAVISALAGAVTAIHPASSPPAMETWQNVTPPSGWTAGLNRYKILAEQKMAIIEIHCTNSGTSGNVTFMTLPAAYIPSPYGSVTRRFPVSIKTSGTLSGNNSIDVNSSGAVTTFALPSPTTEVHALIYYPLD